MIDFSEVPKDPGCYIFSDKKARVIYIGKAKNLNKRVKTYFQSKSVDPKTKKLVEEINGVDFIITDTEVEALILENNLIKKYHPHFNINLKDAKSYAYIRLSQDKFPRLEVARGKVGKGDYFGPFVSAASRDYILAVLKKAFKLRSCKRMPKKACIRYHMNQCKAPCIGEINEQDYGRLVDQVRLVLKGKNKRLIANLAQQMKTASDNLSFEHALLIRDQIEAVKGLAERQKMERNKRYNEDIINFIVKDNTVYLVLFGIYKGTLENKQSFKFEYANKEFFEEFLIQYYSDNRVPGELLVPIPLSPAVISFLEVRAGKAVKARVPQRGDRKKLLELVHKNIEMTYFGDTEKLNQLKESLKMQDLPKVIECFDISHISGTSTVASMVQFRNALPDKSNYRRYRIKTFTGVDDYLGIAEVVSRRYRRLIDEKAEIPDLILIDGGPGQLNSAIIQLKKLRLGIPIISIAKKVEEIYVPGTNIPLVLDKKSKALQLLQHIRDEAHRFAIGYFRLLRKKELLK